MSLLLPITSLSDLDSGSLTVIPSTTVLDKGSPSFRIHDNVRPAQFQTPAKKGIWAAILNFKVSRTCRRREASLLGLFMRRGPDWDYILSAIKSMQEDERNGTVRSTQHAFAMDSVELWKLRKKHVPTKMRTHLLLAINPMMV